MLRKTISKSSFLMALLFVFTIFIASTFAAQVVDPPGGIDISTVFTSIAALAGAVLFFTAIIKKQVRSNDTITIIISALVSFIISGLGWWLQLGIFVSIEWWYIFIYGLAAMLIANGLSTWNVISGLLVFLKLKLPSN